MVSPNDWRCGRDFVFDSGEIAKTVARRGLLALEIEVDPGGDVREIWDVVGQAKALGARCVSIVGDEPMGHAEVLDLVSRICSLRMQVAMFTDGAGMSAEVARFLLANEVRVILRLASGRAGLRKQLTEPGGHCGGLPEAFRSLRDAGYPARNGVLGVSVIVGAENYAELPSFWRWLREEDLEPHFELPKAPVNGARSWQSPVRAHELHSMLRVLAESDRSFGGLEWLPQPPIAGSACVRNRVSCFVTASGSVMPCQGVRISIGSVREKSLAELLRESEILQDLRDFADTIRGPCVDCEQFGRCHGCRGTAFRLTGDYLASDPLCWRNADRQAEIECLPCGVAGVVPHQKPMRLVETLVSIGERNAVVELVVPEDGPFIAASGVLERAAYPEIVAQAAAAWNGFKSRRHDGLPRGYLLGIKRFRFDGAARAGDRLVVSLFKVARFGDFGIMEGKVSKGTHVLARGEIKVWHENPRQTQGRRFPSDRESVVSGVSAPPELPTG
ncbi:MAG: SPASM domain-containing protein [Planctomycetes bacterium]|nr:SPASM domain-containing protein [Planctomycetota bacterium]